MASSTPTQANEEIPVKPKSFSTIPLTPGFVAAHVFAAWGIYVVIEAAIGFENATDALAFYGVYHREPWNQVVHFFGVPGILWSMMMFLVHLQIPVLSEVPIMKQLLHPNHCNYATLLALIYTIFYLNIDVLGGTLYIPILYAMYASSMYMMKVDQKQAGGTTWNGTGRLLAFAFVVHVLSWYVQIHLGHKIIEGAQPAVMQSLGGALTVAPLFAFYEGLWFVGINQELQNSTLALVDQYTRELCDAGAPMRVCESLLSSS